MKVRKAIIPAGGLGTRFLPATKAQPKEMLPLVDTPAIQYIVEEAVQSGITDIIIISGRGKRAIEDHFDKSYELEETLWKREKYEQLNQVRKITDLANIHYIRQKEPKGLGHAVFCAKQFVGDEPFAVLLGDDFVDAETPCLQQLLRVHEKYGKSLIGVQPVNKQDVCKYGVIDFERHEGIQENIVFKVLDLIEKPSVELAPSRYAIMGRYVLSPKVFDILEHLPPDRGNEIQLTDAIKELNRQQDVYACHFQGKRYDIGDKFGFIEATIDMALKRDDLREEVMQYLGKLLYDDQMFNKRKVTQADKTIL